MSGYHSRSVAFCVGLGLIFDMLTCSTYAMSCTKIVRNNTMCIYSHASRYQRHPAAGLMKVFVSVCSPRTPYARQSRGSVHTTATRSLQQQNCLFGLLSRHLYILLLDILNPLPSASTGDSYYTNSVIRAEVQSTRCGSRRTARAWKALL